MGLFRTEYLYLNSSRIPTEQEQFLAYKAVAEAMAPLPVDHPHAGPRRATSRWLAVPTCFQREANPFLGFRAIRFCLEHPRFSRTSSGRFCWRAPSAACS